MVLAFTSATDDSPSDTFWRHACTSLLIFSEVRFYKVPCQSLKAIGLFRGHCVSFDSARNRLQETSGVSIKLCSCSRCENSNDGPMFWICQSQSKVASVHQITCFCVRVCVWDEKDKPTGNSLTNIPKDLVRHTRIRCAFYRYFYTYRRVCFTSSQWATVTS